MPGTILWFRQDLRLADNPALVAAVARGGPVTPVYIHAPDEAGDWPPGGASRWWLHHSLTALDKSLRNVGSRLIICRGPSLDALRKMAQHTHADAVVWNRCYEPAAIARDKRIKSALRKDGLTVTSHNAALLFEPWTIATQKGEPYKVFTPFWKACQSTDEPPRPCDAPTKLQHPHTWPDSLTIDDLSLLPTIPWDQGLRDSWTPGEAGARQRLQHFLDHGIRDYKDQRDYPAKSLPGALTSRDRQGAGPANESDQDSPLPHGRGSSNPNGTSRLSSHLHHGEIGPRQIWHATRDRLKAGAKQNSGTGVSPVDARQNAWAYLREVGWREFAHHLLYHFPHTPESALHEKYRRFPWRSSKKDLAAWQRGQTGYPIVDAGMRELWHTGWMHNRVRMIVASFLVKDLLLPWQDGAAWFWDTLVDADLSNNTLGWQWTAGCGADASPFFRVFNPTLQSEKFHADDYIRHYIPELAALPDKWLHKPWQAPPEVLKQAGITLGNTYPAPIVDHQQARQRALDALEKIKHGSG